ncbi:MAG: regulatory protein RecX [Steroidobacteraceae bacterium]
MAFGRGGPRKVDEHRAADPQAVRAGALAMLARREYASAELASTLARKGYARETVTEVIAELVGEQLLDDNRYAGSLVRMLAGRGQGPARIRQELRQAGLSDELVAEALESGPDWQQLAGEVRQRKFGASTPVGWPARAKQMRFLQYRGFSKDHMVSCLGDVSGVPDDDQ